MSISGHTQHGVCIRTLQSTPSCHSKGLKDGHSDRPGSAPAMFLFDWQQWRVSSVWRWRYRLDFPDCSVGSFCCCFLYISTEWLQQTTSGQTSRVNNRTRLEGSPQEADGSCVCVLFFSTDVFLTTTLFIYLSRLSQFLDCVSRRDWKYEGMQPPAKVELAQIQSQIN